MYTGEQVNELITNIIANLGDQGKVSDLLNDFRADYTGTLKDFTKQTEDIKTLTANNESLRTVNNKIMLQMGDLSKAPDVKTEKEEQEEKGQEPELKFDDLFNEKGELI